MMKRKTLLWLLSWRGRGFKEDEEWKKREQEGLWERERRQERLSPQDLQCCFTSVLNYCQWNYAKKKKKKKESNTVSLFGSYFSLLESCLRLSQAVTASGSDWVFFSSHNEGEKDPKNSLLHAKSWTPQLQRSRTATGWPQRLVHGLCLLAP
jgi:hypothetical protein